jgi:hypothetical protein
MWRDTVSQLAFTYDFLLSAVLSVTALHLASLNPSEAPMHKDFVLQHHGAALRLVLPHMANITSENVAALSVFARLVSTYSIGVNKIQPYEDSLSKMRENFTNVRGMRAVAEKSSIWMENRNSTESVLPLSSELRQPLPKETENTIFLLSSRNHETNSDRGLRESIDEAIDMPRYSFQFGEERPKCEDYSHAIPNARFEEVC